MKSRILLPTFLILLVILATSIYYFSRTAATVTLTIHDTLLRTHVADIAALRERGLSGRKGLAENEAMLFVFDKIGRPGFWMQDMLFSIDMLWLDSDKRVVYILPNIAPETYPNVFKPPADSQYVLEMTANNASRIGIQVGDVAEW
jgi:uncharacterized protein